ncbi:MAG: endonuclease domain-containing protein [Armatimonadetes bacterium]|nr:endonuclease domain-containing protein [Armatimonadota bacterium]
MNQSGETAARRQWRAPEDTKQFAVSLRKRMTLAEKVLWEALRGARLGGHRFRHQVPVGPYVVDFYCPSARLIVEVDGVSHMGRERYDARRDAWLGEVRSLRVLRVTEDEVMGNIETVSLRILAVLDEGA